MASPASGGINVGDAVLTFFGDVTQLDAAFDKINSDAATKLEPARQQAQGVAQGVSEIGVAAETTAVKTAEGFQAMYTAGMSYREFTKANIVAAQEFAGSTQAAFRLIGNSWTVIKQQAADAGAAQKLALSSVGAAAAEEAAQVGAAAATMSQAWVNVAQATVQQSQAQDALREALKMVRVEGDSDVASMIALAQAQQQVALAAQAVASAEKIARAEINTTKTAVVGEGVAAAESAEGWNAVVAAQLRVKETQMAVSKTMSEMSAGTLPRTQEAMAQLAIEQQAAAEAATRLRIALSSVSEAAVNVREAKGEIMVLNHELGLGVDRHMAGWLSRLPLVGEAMEAAFSATMIIVLISLLVEGLNKLIEWTEKSENLRQGWVDLNATFADTTSGINDKIDEQKQKFIELTDGPVAGLDFALAHLKSTAKDSLDSIKTELDAAQQTFMENKGWMPIGDPWKEGAKEMKKFYSDLLGAQESAKTASPGDIFAQYNAMAVVAKERTEEVKQKLKELEEFNENIRANAKANGDTATLNNIQSLAPLQAQLDLLEKINGQLKSGIDLDKQRKDNALKEAAKAAADRAAELGQAEISAKKQYADAEIALDAQKYATLYEHGVISSEQEFDFMRQSEERKYEVEKESLEKRAKLLAADPTKNAAALKEIHGQIQALELTHQGELLKIDEEAYKKNADDNVAMWERVIASSKQGSDDRIALERGLGEYLKSIWGEQSPAYQQQLTKIAEAQRQHEEVMKRLALEQYKTEANLAADSSQAQIQYQQKLVETYRATQASLIQMQIVAEQAELNRKRSALVLQLAQLGPEEVTAREQVNGQIKLVDQQLEESRRMAALETNDILESYYQQLGMSSEESYGRQVEVAQEAYSKILESGASTYQQLRAEASYLQTALQEAVAAGNTDEMSAFRHRLDEVRVAMERFGLAVKNVNILSNNFFDAWHKGAPRTAELVHQMAEMSKQAIVDLAQAEAGAIQSWILGQESLGTAMRKATAQVLAEYAARAAVEAVYWTAYGFAMLASSQYDRAGEAFHAALMLGAFAAVAGGIAAAINPKQASSGTPNQPETQAAAGVTQGPTQAAAAGQNVPHFATGALFSSPTLAVLGDAVGNPSGSQGQKEAVLPLDNPDALEAVGSAIGPRVNGGSGISVYVEGLISPDNLAKVVGQINRMVKRNDVQLTASNSFRVTKKA